MALTVSDMPRADGSETVGPLSVQRTFVVKLGPPVAGDRRMAGRVEHVVTGRAFDFETIEALTDFFRTFMRPAGRHEKPNDE